MVKQVVKELTVQEEAGVALSTDSSGNASALALSGAELEALPDDPDDLQADLLALAGPRRTLLFQQLVYSASQIRTLGGGATECSISTGQPELSVNQTDFGIFAGDDWRLRRNLAVSLGVRYEGQSNIHDWRDPAPRVSAAWALGETKKTVLRAGIGMFYDRFALSNSLAAARYDGLVQQQYRWDIRV